MTEKSTASSFSYSLFCLRILFDYSGKQNKGISLRVINKILSHIYFVIRGRRSARRSSSPCIIGALKWISQEGAGVSVSASFMIPAAAGTLTASAEKETLWPWVRVRTLSRLPLYLLTDSLFIVFYSSDMLSSFLKKNEYSHKCCFDNCLVQTNFMQLVYFDTFIEIQTNTKFIN